MYERKKKGFAASFYGIVVFMRRPALNVTYLLFPQSLLRISRLMINILLLSVFPHFFEDEILDGS